MLDQQNDKIVANAVAQLASVFNMEENTEIITGETQDALWLACSHLGRAMGIEVIKPDTLAAPTTTYEALLAIAQVSQFRVRKIALNDLWWSSDNGPLLAFDQETRQPLALLVNAKGHYEWIDTQTGARQLLTLERAQTLAHDGYMLYRTLPDISLTLWALVKFALRGQKRDIFRLSYLQASMGLLALLIPIGTGVLLNTAAPNADTSLLGQWTLGLLASFLGVASFSIMQEFLFIRLRFKMNAATQSAVWDRLLRLPANFFQSFSAGDLSMRVSGIDAIQQSLTGATLNVLLSSIFALLTLALMCYYAPMLALFAFGLLLVILLTMWLYAWIQLKYQRPILYLQGQLASFALQFLTGISKLRVSHSEKRIFGLWVEQFARKSRLSLLSSLLDIRFSLLRNFLVALGTIGIYALVGFYYTDKMSLGKFISFNAAFGQFFAAALGLGGILSTLIRLIPLYERIQPILTTQPELDKEGEDPGVLSGDIAIKGISFRYPQSPWILQNFSLSINAGEMVALVGSTGCGKSTLFRLLLGFEKPDAGQIFYGEHVLEKLNLRALRKQFGVVLQNDTVLPGSIYETIAGSHPLTIEDVWEIIRQVNLAEDIAAMPMSIHTMMAEAGKTLSTGQRQRLMIARALATKPRILFLDEATSALDNPTQKIIMDNLEKLNITRIVAAHRLSTVVHADKIYVLEHGKIIQSGTYNDLMAEEGLFSTLVRRQLV
jgi:NHLM bacteriocin system ABC transporter ATP-binding protein